MDTLEHLKIRHNLLKELVDNTEKLNIAHHDMEHDLLVTLKKEKLRIKDMIAAEEADRANNGHKN
jgi:hypothetical protein